MPLAEFLELSSLAMTDPMSGAALTPGGEDTDVTMENVAEFVETVTTRLVGFRVSDAAGWGAGNYSLVVDAVQ